MVMSGQSVNIATLFLDRLRIPNCLTSFSPVTNNLPFLNQWKNKSKYVAGPGSLALESDALPTLFVDVERLIGHCLTVYPQ